MLKSWSVENFKSFEKENNLELGPLTIFCGANSSGKSSIIQSMLLIKQTINDSPWDHALALNGPLVQLGTFNDIINSKTKHEEEEPELGIGWIINTKHYKDTKTPHNEKLFVFTYSDWDEYKLNIKFDSNNKGNDHNSHLIPRLKEMSLECEKNKNLGESFHRHSNIKIERPKRKRRLSNTNTIDTNMVNDYAFKVVEIDELSKKEVLEQTGGKGSFESIKTWHFLPNNIIVKYNNYNKKLEFKKKLVLLKDIPLNRTRIATEEMPRELKSKLKDIIHHAVDSTPSFQHEEVNIDRIRTFSEWANLWAKKPPRLRREIQSLINNRASEIEEILSKTTDKRNSLESFHYSTGQDTTSLHHGFFRFHLKYLGPLRNEPKAAYPLQSSTVQNDVGTKGESTAAVLNHNNNTQIEYISPLAFEKNEITKNIKQGTLQQALVEWLNYLQIAENVKTENQGKYGHTLQVKMKGTNIYHDLTNVGVGVSQVLPILVMCLLASRGDTLIFEQPELHLNPSVQTKLTDFFLATIYLQKQCIIETHSEYMIERLRYRIAEDQSDYFLSSSKLYFFKNEQGRTINHNVEMTKYGSITNWPEDFFDQSMKETQKIISAANQRRKAEKENK